MRFENPNLLWLLLVLPPALWAFFAWARRHKARLLAQFVEARLMPSLVTGASTLRKHWSPWLIIAAAMCLVFALARPQWGFTWEEARQRGLDVVVAIDTSRSMLAEDVAPNRLTRAKLAVMDLMKQARTDRLGLIAFAGSAFLMCPLTMDDEAFRQSVNALDTEIIPQGGTAIGPAIEAALGAFKSDADNYKVLVLFTDGENTEEGAIEAAERAAKEDLRIFTIGLGTPNGEVLMISDRRGRQETIKDEDGNAVKSRLDEKTLQEIATIGRGFYLPLRAANTIETLYERGLAPLPKSDSDTMRYQRYHERYAWPLGLAILLLTVEILLPARARARSVVHSGNLASATAALVCLLSLLSMSAQASVNSARKQYEAGKFEDALQEYQHLSARRPDDARLNYNAGAAAYRDGQFAEAMKQFDHATSAQDLALQQQAYYNLGNSLFRLGEALPATPEQGAGGAAGEKPGSRMGMWEQALKAFQSATNLAPQDLDARHNYDYVKRKLDELKQQQPQQDQQQNQDQDQKDKKDEEDKKDQPQQNQDQQQDKDQDQKDQKDQKQDQKQQPKDQKQDQNKSDSKDQKQDQKKDQKQDQKNDQQKSQPKDQKDQKSNPQDPSKQQQQKGDQDKKQSQQQGEGAARPGQMSPQQARQLLDAQRGQEQLLRPVIQATDKPPAKNW